VISVKYLTPANKLLSGGAELIEQWREQQSGCIWIDIEQQPGQAERELLTSFGVHELAIKDAHRDRHPPKVEAFDDHDFLLFKGISELDENLNVEHLQIAVFVGERFLITRHNKAAKSISYWRDNPRVAKLLAEPVALMFCMLHYSAGVYLQLLLDFEERLSELEDMVQQKVDDDAIRELTIYKTRLRKLRRTFDYHERMFDNFDSHMEAQERPLSGNCIHHYQDLFERCERVHSMASMYYEICGDLIEGSLSLASHQLNQTMQVLTVITAVFVPLGFLAGIYGMNFEYIPELQYRYGYFVLIGSMLLIASSLLWLFRRRNWI
jgi:magnesium transporter